MYRIRYLHVFKEYNIWGGFRGTARIFFFSSKFNRTLFLGEAIAELKCPCKSYNQLENSSPHA
jgi:hypothetical protein